MVPSHRSFAMKAIHTVALFLAGVLSFPAHVTAQEALQEVQQDAASAPAKAQANLLSSIAVIGASVSCGAGNSRELGVRRDVPLGVFLQGALSDDQAKASKFLDLGDTFFFMNPDVNGNVQVSKASEFQPTLVVALDFLFWFAYGEDSMKSPRRSEGLERGLEILGRMECPMVVGDLPDIDHALQGVGPLGGPIVHPVMFPSTKERLAMNGRIAEWAKERGNVTMVPLDGLITKMIRRTPVELRGNAWTVKALPEALQKDRLHPTVKGSVWTALHVADAIARLEPSVEPRFRWDVKRAQERVMAATEEDREAKRKADARREARRKAKEERRKQKANK